MLTWVQHQSEYLDEMLRLEGRGYPAIYSKCGGCGEADPKYRCAQQTCYGPGLFCKKCIVSRHHVLPTHWVQEWNGEFFQQQSLKDLGLVIQLGHPPGYSCPAPIKSHTNFVVIDVTGIHHVNVNFCHCDGTIEHRQQLMRVSWWPATARDPRTCATFGVVRLFQIMNCLGKISAHDFLTTMGLAPCRYLTTRTSQDCHQAFRHIVRQYRMTLMLKCAGRGHAPSGVKGTAQGELALPCRACPQPGRNLPQGWDTINWDQMPEDLRYKYFLFLAQDCNFRLINRDVSSAAKDRIIADGLGYFVNHAQYTEFLCGHVSEEEISSCSGFQAMFLANRKCVKGLRTTGVGGVCCARHNMWRPNWIGDLQLGERYCNMDFILLSALLNTIIFYLILSYDIACQYGKNFWGRMDNMPDAMKLVLDQTQLWFKIPNFHLPPHLPRCHSPYSFHYMWGASRTHGETVEQNWEFSNGAAAATKMMGLGTRHATLEDLFGFHNWRRQVAWRSIFARWMAENVKEGQIHRLAFEAFDTALREMAPDLVERWTTWVKTWESSQHTDGVQSPYELQEKVMSLGDIRTKLAKEELLRSGEGDEVEREDTPSTFILMGLEIEESQRYLAVDVKAVANPTDAQSVEFLKRCTNLLKRIRAFCKLQRTYMPALRRHLTVSQCALFDSEVDRNAEAVRLFLPSDILDQRKRVAACAVGLPEVEADLRVGEAREALEALRQGLCTRTMTNRFHLCHCTGQRMLTRGQGVLHQINLKIHKAKLRYRYVRNAIKRLQGDGPWEMELRILEDTDVRALNERALTAEELEQRKSIHDYEDVVEEGGVAAFGEVALSEGRRTLSWTWYQVKVVEPSEVELVEALRVEWCKAYSRMRRWYEDVVLVEEEMRRTVEYGYWSAATWEQRVNGRAGAVEAELQEGLAAYAREQRWRETETCDLLARKWVGVREKGRAYLSGEKGARTGILVLDLDEDKYRGDERDDDVEEGPPDYEDEGDDEVVE
ncbi:hypothetical protein C8R45DRAFT_826688 [Mycena sanguinolenta]|nr:hypothetical protein C8R45DRAFT_826688 [Mycena sanguinolenta]